MQRVLVVKRNETKIISKPWCFEAMCLISDTGGVENGLKACMPAISYLFEGTQITDDDIRDFTSIELRTMVEALNRWFIEDMMELLKFKKDNTNEANNSTGSGGLRDIYNSIFKAWGTMPSEVAKQPPMFIFNLLKGEDDGVDVYQLPDDIKALYGM